MSFAKVSNKENALVLTTPKRNELLKDGPSQVKLNNCQILGRGAYGTVFKAIYRDNSVALKVIRNSAVSTLHSEAHILNWKHKNIVRLIKLESTSEFGLLIMERPSGLCLQRVVDTLSLPLRHRVFITLDILAALRYCHCRNVLHLDVKPSNILVALGTRASAIGRSGHDKRSYICKLCDFGSSIKLDESSSNRSTTKGTLRYMSPEALRSASLTSAADIYSLGITMWQLQARRLPFDVLNCNETIAYQVVKHDLRPDNYDCLESLKLGNASLINCYSADSDPTVNCQSADLLHDCLSKIGPQLDVVMSSDLLKKPNILARRTLNFDSTHGRVHKRRKAHKQPRLAHCFDDLFPVSAASLESAYIELYKGCWVSQPDLRLSAYQLQKRLELILIKCFPIK